MNQKCQVCGERAAGYHFGAFTCEGCKSFFGRSYNNPSISECKNNGKCIIDKKNRTTCKACRLAKCYAVNMSKGGSRYGRRPNSFKIQYLLQEQQQQAAEAAGFGDMAAAIATAMAQQHMQCNPHLLAAQHIGGFLGYPAFLPEMMQQQCSPFMSLPPSAAREQRASEATNSNAMPFMGMMNSLPMPAGQHGNFAMPGQFMFPGYQHQHHHRHPANSLSSSSTVTTSSSLSSSSSSASTSSGANTPVCHTEMFKDRQSVESFVSGDSIQRYSPGMRSSSACTDDDRLFAHTASQSPELCVADEQQQQQQQSTIHTPIARHAMSKDNSVEQKHAFQPISAIKTHRSTPLGRSSEAISPIHTSTPIDLDARDAPNATQDTPIDLSMKVSAPFSLSAIANAIDSQHNDERILAFYRDHAAMRRKFCQLQREQEFDSASSSESASATATSIHHADGGGGIKRQRRLTSPCDGIAYNAAMAQTATPTLSTAAAAAVAAAASVTSLHGIFAGV